MANPISPGVYTKIIDLSTYVQAVPGTVGLMCGITKKGEDNKIKFVSSRSELVGLYGEPNIIDYGSNFSQGLYCAYNFLGESSSLYFMRCLPTDASFANQRIDITLDAGDTTAGIGFTYVSDVESLAEIKTNLVAAAPTYPLCMIYPIGRGEYYNALGLRITEHSNSMLFDTYVLDIYEKQSDGDTVIIESFEVSFNPQAMDSAGDSIFIVDILQLYSSVIRAEMTLASGAYTEGYDQWARIYDKNIGTVSAVKTDGAATITDTNQVFTPWETDPEAGDATSGDATYCIVAKDGKGVEIWGWLGASTDDDGAIINVFNERTLAGATQSWNGSPSTFDKDSEITYIVKKSYGSVADGYVLTTPYPLKRGSDGSLLDATGDIVASEGNEVLANGYAGAPDYDPEMLDPERMYFNMIFDAGYHEDVKAQIVTLAEFRKDCVAILDNGDNTDYTASMTARANTQTYNTYYAALYEEYNRTYDIFSGRDVWFSPMYHMSYLLPRNDKVAEIWYAAAGFNRASINTIKELRFNPRSGQRDQMYLKQINPIVQFNAGYVVWGQLTTQAKASALQDLNIVRLVLYIQRALAQYSQFFIFELNDQITWSQVSGAITVFLEDIRARRGLYNYSVSVGATEYELKSKTFHIDVELEPTRVAEHIMLNFFIK